MAALRDWFLSSALSFFFVTCVLGECVFEFRPVYQPGSTTIVNDYQTYFNGSRTTECGA